MARLTSTASPDDAVFPDCNAREDHYSAADPHIIFEADRKRRRSGEEEAFPCGFTQPLTSRSCGRTGCPAVESCTLGAIRTLLTDSDRLIVAKRTVHIDDHIAADKRGGSDPAGSAVIRGAARRHRFPRHHPAEAIFLRQWRAVKISASVPVGAGLGPRQFSMRPGSVPSECRVCGCQKIVCAELHKELPYFRSDTYKRTQGQRAGDPVPACAFMIMQAGREFYRSKPRYYRNAARMDYAGKCNDFTRMIQKGLMDLR